MCTEHGIVAKRGRSFGLSPLHHMGWMITTLSATSIRTFFCVASKTSQLMLVEIEGMIEDSFFCLKHDEKEDEAKCRLEIIRRNYDTVYMFVDQVNEIFGPILLLNLAWIFYQSLCTFCEMLLSYAYIVIICLQFDLRQMLSSFFLVQLRSHGQYSKAGRTFHDVAYNSPAGIFKLYLDLEKSSYLTITYSAFVFATLWSRLMVILVPANQLKNQVHSFFYHSCHFKVINKKCTFRGNLYSTACAESKLPIANNCFFKYFFIFISMLENS